MKKLMLLFVLLMPLIVNAGSKHMRGFWMANHLYASESSVSLPQEYKEELGQLLMDVWDGSTYQDCYAAQKAAQYLQKDVDTRLEALKHLTSEDESKKVALENSLFIIEQQQNWLQVKVQELAEKLTVKDKVFGFFYDVYATVINFFGKQDVIVVGNTATKIYDYARFEREQLFINFQATSQWLSVQKKVGFPNLIYFWKDKKAAHLLLLRLKKYGQNIQLLGEVIDEGVELIGVDAGATKASLEALQESVDQTIEMNLLKPLEDDGASALNSSIRETNIDSVISNAVESATEGTVEEEVLSQLNKAIESVAQGTSAIQAVDAATTGSEGIINRISGWYQSSYVGRFFKFIANQYDQLIEAPYKRYIYDNLIAPLEKNSLNDSLKVLPHYFKMPIDMLIQTEVMQGGGLVASWASADNAKAFIKLVNQQSAIVSSGKSFSDNLIAQQSILNQISIDNFFKNINEFVNYQQLINDTAQTQLAVMSKSLLQQQQNPAYYLDQDYSFFIDEKFRLSPMYNAGASIVNNPIQSYQEPSSLNPDAPVLPATLPFVGAWHNIWRTGNWEYMANEKAFYQLNLVPLVAPLSTDKNGLSVADQAFYNSIFTEYYPKSSGVVQPYTVSVDIDITQVTYPFFVGVIFNNARWISGVQDRSRQQRYAGFYGTADKTIYLIVTQSLISSQDQIKTGVPSMQSPFYVITNNDISNFITAIVSSNTATTSFSGKYNLSINTQPTQAAITLTSQITATPVVTTINATNLNSNFYNFHGIGLVSAGASASFVVQQPASIGFPTAILSQTKG